MSTMPEMHDANFSWAGFVRANNDILVGAIGNFIHRTLVLARDARVDSTVVAPVIRKNVNAHLNRAREELLGTRFKEYTETVAALADLGNKYLSKKEPWKDRNHGAVEFNRILSNSIYIILGLFVLIKPLLPDAAERLSEMLGVDFSAWPEEKDLRHTLDRLSFSDIKPLFVKINPEIIGIESDKLGLT